MTRISSCRPQNLARQASDLRQTQDMAADRWRAPGGWTVEIVHLTGTPNHHDGQWLRVCQYGSWTADVRTVDELAQYVDLAELEPELMPARCVRRSILGRVTAPHRHLHLGRPRHAP